MKSFSDFPLLSIANDKVKKTLKEKAENQHLDGVFGMCFRSLES